MSGFSKDSKCDYCGATFGTMVVFALMEDAGAIMQPSITYCSYSPDHKHSFKGAFKKL